MRRMPNSPEYSKVTLFRRTDSDLAGFAGSIVTYVAEIKKPDSERLPGFHDAQLESLRFRLESPAPVYPALEIARMTGSLEQARQELGADDEWLKIVLAGKSPQEAAERLHRRNQARGRVVPQRASRRRSPGRGRFDRPVD